MQIVEGVTTVFSIKYTVLYHEDDVQDQERGLGRHPREGTQIEHSRSRRQMTLSRSPVLNCAAKRLGEMKRPEGRKAESEKLPCTIAIANAKANLF